MTDESERALRAERWAQRAEASRRSGTGFTRREIPGYTDHERGTAAGISHEWGRDTPSAFDLEKAREWLLLVEAFPLVAEQVADGTAPATVNGEWVRIALQKSNATRNATMQHDGHRWTWQRGPVRFRT